MTLRNDLDPNSSVVYLALNILCSSQNSLIPELLYILSPQQIIEFIKVFGGETIKVPTPRAFNSDLLAGIACYHVLVEGKSWDWFELKYNLNGNSVRAVQARIDAWMMGLTREELNFIKSLKKHDESQKAREKASV
jgi:hypothetical protein